MYTDRVYPRGSVSRGAAIDLPGLIKLENELKKDIQAAQGRHVIMTVNACKAVKDQVELIKEATSVILRRENENIQKLPSISYETIAYWCGFGPINETITKVDEVVRSTQSLVASVLTNQTKLLQIAYCQKKSIQAVDLFAVAEKLLEIVPNDIDILQLMADCFLREGAYDKACEYYNKTIPSAKDEPQLLMKHANALIEIGKLDMARQKLDVIDKKLAEQKDEDLACKIALLRAESYLKEKDFDRANEVMKHIIAKYPENNEMKKACVRNYILAAQKLNEDEIRNKYFLENAKVKFFALDDSKKNIWQEDSLFYHAVFWVFAFTHQKVCEKKQVLLARMLEEIRQIFDSGRMKPEAIALFLAGRIEEMAKQIQDTIHEFDTVCTTLSMSSLSENQKACIEARIDRIQASLFGPEKVQNHTPPYLESICRLFLIVDVLRKSSLNAESKLHDRIEFMHQKLTDQLHILLNRINDMRSTPQLKRRYKEITQVIDELTTTLPEELKDLFKRD